MLLFQHTFHGDSGHAGNTFSKNSRKKYRANPKHHFKCITVSPLPDCFGTFVRRCCQCFFLTSQKSGVELFFCACSIHIKASKPNLSIAVWMNGTFKTSGCKLTLFGHVTVRTSVHLHAKSHTLKNKRVAP